MSDVAQLIEQVLSGHETESELGRVRAYRACVRYAEEHLAGSRECNAFLFDAAERLGQAPMALPVVFNRVPLPANARVCFYYNDDEGPVLVGNQPGLSYLAGILGELAEAPIPGESIYLDPDHEPFVGENESLTVYLEVDEWFDAALEGREEELAEQWEAEIGARIVNPDEVSAVQFTVPLHSSLALSPRKIYRLCSVSQWEPSEVAPRKPFRNDTERLVVIELVDDDDHSARLVVDLDDDEIEFYYPWHLAQLGGGRTPSS